MDQLTLETAEEVFGNGVIVGVSFAGHALADAIGIQPFPVGLGRILHAPVTVEESAPLAACGGGMPCPGRPAAFAGVPAGYGAVPEMEWASGSKGYVILLFAVVLGQPLKYGFCLTCS